MDDSGNCNRRDCRWITILGVQGYEPSRFLGVSKMYNEWILLIGGLVAIVFLPYLTNSFLTHYYYNKCVKVAMYLPSPFQRSDELIIARCYRDEKLWKDLKDEYARLKKVRISRIGDRK